MPRVWVFTLLYLATFLQAGTYGLTFLLPRLFAGLDGNEKDVGIMLSVTAVSTILSVYYCGHLTDRLGAMMTLVVSGLTIALSLYLFASSTTLGGSIVFASILLGFGWGGFYTLGPVVLTNITQPDERVRYFSMYSVFMMAGFGLSPVMAAIMENMGNDINTAFTTTSIVCLVSAALFALLNKPIANLNLATPGSASPSHSARLSILMVTKVLRSKGRLSIIMVCLGASVFAGLNNFQTVFADQRGLDYADFFLTYTITVVICRLLLAGFSGGKTPYLTIARMQTVMFLSVILFIFSAGNQVLYFLVAILFGIGYGASYPILTAMAANDAEKDILPHTLQLFALTYFIGIFGFPLIAGWVIVEMGTTPVLIIVAGLAFIEAALAWRRGRADLNNNPG